MKRENILPHNIAFIGDTVHNYKVVSHIGYKCALVAGGHLSEYRSKATGKEVVSLLNAILPSFVFRQSLKSPIFKSYKQ